MVGDMENPPQVTTQVIGDVPLLVGVMIQMDLPGMYDRAIGDHGLHSGLSGGWMLLVWQAFMLSRANHTKYRVETWVSEHADLLSELTGQVIRAGDFNDTKLSALLTRVSDVERWRDFEAALWQHSVQAYQIEQPGGGGLVSRMVDSTTTYGYHATQAEGVMQRGHSKDHRPDLPQLKLMTVAAHPSGQSMVSEVLSGNTADDGQYTPIIGRVRQMSGQVGVLYVGDSKMAALATRAEIARHHDYYLTVAPQTGETATALPGWIEAGLDGTHPLETLYDPDGAVIGQGYEFQRHCRVAGEHGLEWRERVQVFRSDALAQQQTRALDERLGHARDQVSTLGVAQGRGHRHYTDRDSLEQAIQAVLEQQRVDGLLTITVRDDTRVTTRQVGRGRPSAQRPTHQVSQPRFAVADVQRNEPAIEHHQRRLGWRVQLTTAPAAITLNQSINHYRANWLGERNYHRLKEEPIGISPLFVRNDDQIIGLTHLLVLGTRVCGLMEWQVKCGLAHDGKHMCGLYPGLPKKATPTPTVWAMLDAIARMNLILTMITWHDQTAIHLTPLPDLLLQILSYMHLPVTLYTRLADHNSANTV